ncbi:hypothetical protein [Halovivax gelatinilyticus]|uniref:hypothetical protein n=1 Tax=Halovivax gelatinilyticus TaxID=2961597 RepID=UPI0020CA2818|nr:hypothetical protein [Halovivax gelatinilyticus]
MVLTTRRRTLALGALAGGSLLGTGAYGWSRYASRNHLDMDIRAVNRSDEPASVSVLVYEDGAVFYERDDEIGPAGGERPPDERYLGGPWIKRRGAYSLEISAVGETVDLPNEAIIDRLTETGWGPESVETDIVIADDRTLDVVVESAD